MLMKEEFARCKECGDGYFEVKTFVTLSKDSTETNPQHLSEFREYVCRNCNTLRMTTKVYQ